MRGERLEHAELGPAGLRGDREWALLDEDRHWVSAKADKARWRLYDGMLDLVATTGEDGDDAAGGARAPRDTHPVTVALPDGRTARAGTPEADALLSAHLGRTLHFDHGDRGHRWGRHHDAAPLHLVTTATLRALRPDDGDAEEGDALDPLRLRPNLVVRTPPGVDGFPEDGWVGTAVRVGDAVLRVVGTTGRCVMTTRAQGDGLARDTTVLTRIGRRNGADAGIYLEVERPGRVAVGDVLSVA
jgi:uncharacterized protein YcbX